MPTPDVNQIVPGSNGTVPPVVPVTPVVPEPGSQTDPVLLLKSLKEEREKRQGAEAELKRLQDALASGEPLSEEGKALKVQIEQANETIKTLTRTVELSTLHEKFPALKDKGAEFQAYLDDPQNKGMSLDTAARAFIADSGLNDAPTRKGMETPGGGGRQNTPQGWTYAAIEDLRKNNFRQYTKLLKEGAFNDVKE